MNLRRSPGNLPVRGTSPLGLLLAASLVAASVTWPAQTALAQPVTESDRADELYKQGVAAFEAQKLEEAEKLFVEAWKLKKGVDIAANLGIVSLQLGKNVQAAEALTYAVDHFPVGASADARARLAEKLALVKQKVAAVTLKVDVAEAQLSVDERDLGKAPLPEAVFVDPGPHQFKAVLDGYEPAEVSFRLLGGDATTIELSLKVKPMNVPEPVGVAEKLPVWPMIAFGALTAAGLGLGIGTFVMSESAKGDIEDSGCRNASCGASLQGSVDDYNLGRSLAVSGFVAGGVGAIGLVTYAVLYATSGTEAEPAKSGGASTRIYPLAGLDAAGAVLVHSF